MMRANESDTHDQAARDSDAERAMTPGAVRPTRWQRIVSALAVSYTVSLAILCAWMYWRGDVGRFATLLLFGPRWMLGVPLPLLVVLALIWRRRMLGVLALAMVILLVPFMGLVVHWPAGSDTPISFRLLTFNVSRRLVDIPRLAQMIAETHPDLVVLQEGDQYADYHWPRDWQTIVQDEFIVASPWPLKKREFLPHPWALTTKVVARFEVQAPGRTVQLFDIHLRTPRAGLDAVLKRKNDATQKLDNVLEERNVESITTSRWIASFEGAKLVAGDFNMPVESAIFRRDWTGLNNAFSESGLGFGYTKLTDIGPLRYGTRIDHVLYDDQWQCVRAWVGENLGSDHLPLFADFR
jgi:vancomycin resistance protein VanJ